MGDRPYPIPENEDKRLARLRQYAVLDTPPEEAFDRATRLATQIMGTPIALVSLVDQDRQWFKSRVGLDALETPRDVAFCAHAIMTPEPFVVRDATQDERFSDNPLVVEQPAIRFYAGAPLTTRDGMNIGTLCAIDMMPREPTDDEISSLKDLAQMVVDELDLRAVGRLALEEVAMRKRLDDLKSAFIADVNHELRTPLTSIIGSLGLLSSGMMGELPEKPAELLTIADRNANQLLTLINDLLDMSKLESGAIEFEFETLEAVDLAKQAVENTLTYAVDKNLSIVTESSSPEITIQGDKRRLTQVLNNLLSNAIKFSPKDSQIDVALLKSQETLRINVKDRGVGISEDQQGKIFEKFVQAKASDKIGVQGTGLGLSICKSIVEAHGGRIGVESEEGKGANFFVELPIQILPQASV